MKRGGKLPAKQPSRGEETGKGFAASPFSQRTGKRKFAKLYVGPLWFPQTKFMEIDTYRYMVYQRQLAQVLICEIPLPLPPLDPPQDLVGRVEEFFPPPPSFIFSPRPTTDRRTPILLPLLLFSSPFALYQTSRAKRRREGGEQTPPPPLPLPPPTTATIREVEGGGSLGRNGKRDREGYFTFLYLPF